MLTQRQRWRCALIDQQAVAFDPPLRTGRAGVFLLAGATTRLPTRMTLVIAGWSSATLNTRPSFRASTPSSPSRRWPRRSLTYHAKYRKEGVEDPRAWNLAQGSWNAPAWTDKLAMGQLSPHRCPARPHRRLYHRCQPVTSVSRHDRPRRCVPCNLDWPHLEKYARCPGCNGKTGTWFDTPR